MDKKLLILGKKTIGVLLALLVVAINFLPQMQVLRKLENGETVDDIGKLAISLEGYVPITVYNENEAISVVGDMSKSLKNGTEIEIKVCGITVKSVSVAGQEKIMLMPGGQSIGVRLHTMGALIVGFGDVVTQNAEKVKPSKKAGLEIGDIVIEIDGTKITSADDVTKLCNESTASEVEVTVLRSGEYKSFCVKKEFDIKESEYKLGLWVRDSTVGIGTLSFYRMSDKKFGALGHAITDIDTGALLIAQNGDIVLASVTGVNVGRQGTPGELIGAFSVMSRKLGSIEINSEKGLYGTMYGEFENPIYSYGVEAAYSNEIKEGKAKILTTVDETGVMEYDCEIERVYRQSERSEKDMVIKITDKRLISKTGGIVQGMSGSPILQDGKLVGAVTHVLVNDPTRGYGIFIENMLNEAK